MKWFLCLLLLSGLIVVLIHSLQPVETKAVFMDVGQGDSILFQSGTTQVLVDGGPGLTVLSRLAEELPWFDRKIDVVIATHPDRDHLEGLAHVLTRYQVGLVLLPEIRHTSVLQEEWLRDLQQLVERKEVAYRFAREGEKITMEDIDVTILGPFLPMVAAVNINGKTNNASVITRVVLDDLTFLLTGDAEAITEKQLIEHTSPDVLNVDVVKAGHHGSKTSTTEELLKATTPKVVVISVGADNTYGHPTKEILNRLKAFSIPIYRTDEKGSIRFIKSNTGWHLKCSRKSCNDI